MRVEEFRARHLSALAARVRRAAPIQLTLVGFPFKVPNPLKVGPRTLPDLAELAAIKKLRDLRQEVQAVYPPGIQLVVIQDGGYIGHALGVPAPESHQYGSYLRWLIRITGTDSFIDCVDLVDLLKDHWGGTAPVAAPDESERQWLEAEASRRPDPALAFKKTLGMVNVRSLPNTILDEVFSKLTLSDPLPAHPFATLLHGRVCIAMERYLAADGKLHRFDPRYTAFPEAIHATTRSQPGRLALWLVERGKGILPWHGVGVLRGDGRATVSYGSNILAKGVYRAVYLKGETTPFCYEAWGSA